MKASNLWYLCAVVSAVMLPELAIGDGHCSHATKIRNDSNVTFQIVELKSAIASPILFKSQWKGNRAIAPGASATILWTSNFACNNSTGKHNLFDVKLVLRIGETHYCSGLSPNQSESVARYLLRAIGLLRLRTLDNLSLPDVGLTFLRVYGAANSPAKW